MFKETFATVITFSSKRTHNSKAIRKKKVNKIDGMYDAIILNYNDLNFFEIQMKSRILLLAYITKKNCRYNPVALQIIRKFLELQKQI